MRRLPVYILIDTSGSMRGEPIESVKVGLDAMLATLRSDPYSLETVSISIITFDRDIKILLPLTPLDDLQLPDITTPESGPTHTGAALEALCQQVDKEVRLSSPTQKGDWMPLLFIMTDGKPSDIQKFNEVIPLVKKRHFANVVACAAGMKAETSHLKALTPSVYSLDSMDSASFKSFFLWVSNVINEGGRSIGSSACDITLPPPPDEINVVI